jgi:hypothetical protein
VAALWPGADLLPAIGEHTHRRAVLDQHALDAVPQVDLQAARALHRPSAR